MIKTRLLRMLPLLIVLVCSPASAQLSLTEAEKLARGYTLRLDTGSKQLTAVVVQHSESFIDIATCYHGVIQAKEIDLLATQPDRKLTTIARYENMRGSVKASVHPRADLAFFRIPAEKAPELVRFLQAAKTPREPIWDRANKVPQDQEVLHSYAFGFPFYSQDELTTKVIRLTGRRVLLDDIPGATDKESKLTIEIIDLEPTAVGMSGGPVVNSYGDFAGLVLGRLVEPARKDAAAPIDPAGMIIPATEARHFFPKRDEEWTDLDLSALTAEESPFSKAALQSLETETIPDVVSWKELPLWEGLFGDASSFRYRFQEVTLPWKTTAAEAAKGGAVFEIQVDPATYSEDRYAEEVEFWLNGKSTTLRKKDGQRVNLSEFVVPGENLLIVSKKRRLNNLLQDFSLDTALGSSTLNIDLYQHGECRQRLIRSLPGIVDRFAIFVTFQNGPAPIAGYHGRLAVKLEVLEQMLATTPFRWKQKFHHSASGSRAQARFEFQTVDKSFLDQLAKRPTEPRALPIPASSAALSQPPQSLGIIDFATQWTAHFDNYRANALGVSVEEKEAKIQIPLILHGRLQFARDTAGNYFLCPRVIASRSSEAHRLRVQLAKLGETPVTVDLTGLLQEFLLEWVNAAMLSPTSPQTIIDNSGTTMLEAAAIKDFSQVSRFRAVQLIVRAGWAVLTFAIKDSKLPFETANPVPKDDHALALLEGKGFDLSAASLLPVSLRRKGLLENLTATAGANASFEQLSLVLRKDGAFRLEVRPTVVELDGSDRAYQELASAYAEALQKIAVAGHLNVSVQSPADTLLKIFRERIPGQVDAKTVTGNVALSYSSQDEILKYEAQKVSISEARLQPGEGVDISGINLSVDHSSGVLKTGKLQSGTAKGKLSVSKAVLNRKLKEAGIDIDVTEITGLEADFEVSLPKEDQDLQLMCKNCKATLKGKATKKVVIIKGKLEDTLGGDFSIDLPAKQIDISVTKDGKLTVKRIRVEFKLGPLEVKFDL